MILLNSAIRIPPEAIGDFAAFRSWTRSKDFPERGEYSFLNGDLWADLTMETLIHNQIKSLIGVVVGGIILAESLGRFFSDRMRLVHEAARLSSEPDSMFVSHESETSGRVHWEQGATSLEVIGSPDMVLEVVSSTSVEKDTVVLRKLYAAAGIREYWLINPLGGQLSFEILRLTGRRYAAVRKTAGWIKSPVFGKSFRLIEEPGTAAPQYKLLVR